MKKIMVFALCILCAFSSCQQGNVNKNEVVELTPEFILSVQKYDALGEFSEGLAPVGLIEDDTQLWGYINTKGEEVIPCKIEAQKVGCFSEGMACIIKDGVYSFIDRDGKDVLHINIPGAIFDENVSFVKKEALPSFKNGECGLRFTDKVIFINKEGKQLREEAVTMDFPESKKVKYKSFSGGDGYNDDGLKDERGNIVIPAIYNEIIGDGESGVFLATLVDKDSEEGEEYPYVGYVDLKGHDTFPVRLKNEIQKYKEPKESKAKDPVAFANALQEAKWIKSEENFKYPDIMQRFEFYDKDVPTTFEIYSCKDVILSFCFLGAWASSDEFFPVPGNVISQNCIIADLAYNFKSEIFSGHTTDGRIFYLKRIVGWPGEAIPHPYILALIYPPEYQDAVKPLIEIVRKWSAS